MSDIRTLFRSPPYTILLVEQQQQQQQQQQPKYPNRVPYSDLNRYSHAAPINHFLMERKHLISSFQLSIQNVYCLTILHSEHPS